MVPDRVTTPLVFVELMLELSGADEGVDFLTDLDVFSGCAVLLFAVALPAVLVLGKVLLLLLLLAVVGVTSVGRLVSRGQ